MVSELIKRKESYTFRNILERSKTIGKKPKMEISISHISSNRTSNKLLNTINHTNQQKIIHEFDVIKDELYKEKEVVQIKSGTRS
mmetsp:Transcript_24518/g.21761  ORF Transcript_24518/g.21761 Transcript_24518/m.21761 type:complete len:85 (+) Transcript_24518:181-435(+)